MAGKTKTSHSLDQVIGDLALQKLAKTTPEEFLAEFKRQGVNSLEDLVSKTLETVRANANRGSVAFDDELVGVCYRFTSYRPHFDPKDLGDIENIIQERLME